MKLPKSSLLFCCFSLSVLFTGGSTTPVLSAMSGRESAQGADKFIYADYKYLTLQLYVTGVTSVTVEFISKGQGIRIDGASPQMSFKVSKGFNTYKVPLNSLTQPSYVETRVKPIDLLKKLTQVNISVACNQCVPISGTVVIDNLIFQN